MDSPASQYRVYSTDGRARRLKTPSGGWQATGLYAIDVMQRNDSNGGPIRADGRAPKITTASNVGVLYLDDRPHQVRRLTPTECERLQGFPDGYTEGHSDTQRYRMIGNAVMVPLAKYVGELISAAYPNL